MRYYKYFWWGVKSVRSGDYDFFAYGKHGQCLYVSPSQRTVFVRLGEKSDPDMRWPYLFKQILTRLNSWGGK